MIQSHQFTLAPRIGLPRSSQFPLGSAPPSATGFVAEAGFSVSVLSDGGFIDGATVRVIDTQSQFGTKSPAKPYLWVPFEGNANPSSLGVVQNWSALGYLEYNATEGFNGSGCFKGVPPPHHANNDRATWTATINDNSFAWNDPGQQMYLFRRTKLNFAIVAEMNWKTFRAWPGPFVPSSPGGPNWYMATSNGSVITEYLGDTFLGSARPWDPFGKRAAMMDTENKWQTEEVLAQANTDNTLSDGEFYDYLNGELVAEMPYTTYMTFYFKLRDTSERGSQPIKQIIPVHGVLQNYGQIDPGLRYWADDIYLDRTWARVMIISDGAYTNDSLEIQIPTTWSSSQIDFILRVGGFSSLAGKKLYVFDQSNTRHFVGQFTE